MGLDAMMLESAHSAPSARFSSIWLESLRFSLFQLNSTWFSLIRLDSTLFYSSFLYATPFDSILLYSVLPYPTLIYSNGFDWTLFDAIHHVLFPLGSIRLELALFSSILHYSTLFDSTLLYFTLLCSTVLCYLLFLLLCTVLFYSVLPSQPLPSPSLIFDSVRVIAFSRHSTRLGLNQINSLRIGSIGLHLAPFSSNGIDSAGFCSIRPSLALFGPTML